MVVKANRCPNCHGKLMPTHRMFFDVGPGTILTCDHCGETLKKSNMGIFYLLLMVVIGLAVPTFYVFTTYDFGNVSRWLFFSSAAAYLLFWVLFTTVTSWYIFGWNVVNEED